jgi:hypothetical protein
MTDTDEPGPSEGAVRLLRCLLAVIVLYLFSPCVSCGLSRVWNSGGSSGLIVPLLLYVPPMLVVPLSAAGFVLARSPSSRALFLVTGLLGGLVFLAVVMGKDLIID